jgi:hypothetical protein
VAVEIFGAQGNPILPAPALIALPQNYSVECFNPPSDKAKIEVRCSPENSNRDNNSEPDANSNSNTQPAQRRQ